MLRKYLRRLSWAIRKAVLVPKVACPTCGRPNRPHPHAWAPYCSATCGAQAFKASMNASHRIGIQSPEEATQ